MQQVKGIAVSRGIGVGKIFIRGSAEQAPQQQVVKDITREIARVEAARVAAIGQLDDLYRKTAGQIGKAGAEIFLAQKTLLADEGMAGQIRNLIEGDAANAEYAVYTVGERIAGRFAALDDEVMRARAVDIRDVSRRVLRNLSGKEAVLPESDEPVILLAEELTPSEAAQLSVRRLAGIVTGRGSANSHTAILARSLNIPAVTGITPDLTYNGKNAVIDGEAGTLTLEPDAAFTRKMKKAGEKEEERRQTLLRLKDVPSVTKSGREVKVVANVTGLLDTEAALDNGAEGIGLFRSEFLYLETNVPPSEEKQYAVYRAVLQKMGEKPVIIRTLDLGADKQVPYFDFGPEENPALGYRAVRICLNRPDIFRTQLRAIYRASVYGKAAIMFPMIISVDEVRRCKAYCRQVQAELRAEGIPFAEDVPLGIMIETPAAAVISGKLAREADFFSIGTNDLTQYTLAIDRQNPWVADMSDAHHPAVLQLIRQTIENGHKRGIRVGICGELAAEPKLTRTFLEYGVDELSVAPSYILPVRSEVVNAE